MNPDQIRAALASATAELHERNNALVDAQRAIDEAPEDADVEALRDAHTRAADAFDEQASEVERLKINLADAERRQRVITENPVLPEPIVRVLSEEPTYRRGGERSFFVDAFRAEHLGDATAREIMARNAREQSDIVRERYGPGSFRDVGTTAFSGLVVPQYLVDLYAPLARAGSPFVNACPKIQLPPDGLTLNVSRLTTGSAAAAQATENTEVQETNMDDTLLTINVRTYAGQQDVSRQLLDRGSLGDELVYRDLVSSYFTVLDSAVLNADGTSGTHLGLRSTSGIISVAYTDATPTVGEAYAKFADAIQQINSQRFEPATTIVVHPRRWGWFTAALDTAGRPLVVPNSNGPFNAIGVGEAAEYGQVVGTLHGLPVITDANIPTNVGAGTNEDVVIVTRIVDDLLFWEGDGMPRQFRFEQVPGGPQSIRLAVWGYTAFTAGRQPAANAVISGTGLIPPTF